MTKVREKHASLNFCLYKKATFILFDKKARTALIAKSKGVGIIRIDFSCFKTK